MSETKKPFNSREYLNNIRKMPMRKFPQWLQAMIDEKRRLIKSGEVNDLHVYLSQVNKKGAPRSVSTIPVHDCPNCSKCALQCYDLRHDVRTKEVRHTRSVNSAILEYDRERFFAEIDSYCKTLDKFRWHVGGDILDLDYFKHVVKIAINNPHCQFHIFTKNYDAVNAWIQEQFDLPFGDKPARLSDFLQSNLNLRFSAWPGVEMPNPFDIPTSEVVFEDEFIRTENNTALCTGNCSECAILSCGCFDRNIKTVYLPVH